MSRRFAAPYQTSVFLATTLAIRNEPDQWTADGPHCDTEAALKRWSAHPLLFEIGRTAPRALPSGPIAGFEKACKPGKRESPFDDIIEYTSIQPEMASLYPEFSWPARLGVFLFTMVLFSSLLSFKPVRRRLRVGPIEGSAQGNKPGPAVEPSVLWLVALGLVVCLFWELVPLVWPRAAGWLTWQARLGVFLSTIALLSVLLSFPTVRKRFSVRIRSVAHSAQVNKPMPEVEPGVLWLVGLGLVVFLLWEVVTLDWPQLARWLTEDGQGEPMALFEGISVWPTIALRVFGILLSVLLIWWTLRTLALNLCDTRRRIGLPDIKESIDSFGKVRNKFDNLWKNEQENPGKITRYYAIFISWLWLPPQSTYRIQGYDDSDRPKVRFEEHQLRGGGQMVGPLHSRRNWHHRHGASLDWDPCASIRWNAVRGARRPRQGNLSLGSVDGRDRHLVPDLSCCRGDHCLAGFHIAVD
jgi:hypothetical protein